MITSDKATDLPGTIPIALPSKGRFQEQIRNLFEKVGIRIERAGGTRNYTASISNFESLRPSLRSPAEIAIDLGKGNIALGFTGEDLLFERWGQHNALTARLLPLGVGHADLVIAVPDCWSDVRNVEDLEDAAVLFKKNHGKPLRIATKYLSLTRNFLRVRGVGSYRLLTSQSATEGAVASGLAEAISDITSTGATLRANHLRPLDDGLILRSQACLFASTQFKWSKQTLALTGSLIERLQKIIKEPSNEFAVFAKKFGG